MRWKSPSAKNAKTDTDTVDKVIRRVDIAAMQRSRGMAYHTDDVNTVCSNWIYWSIYSGPENALQYSCTV